MIYQNKSIQFVPIKTNCTKHKNTLWESPLSTELLHSIIKNKKNPEEKHHDCSPPGPLSMCDLVVWRPGPGWTGSPGWSTRPAGRWTGRLLCFLIRRGNLQETSRKVFNTHTHTRSHTKPLLCKCIIHHHIWNTATNQGRCNIHINTVCRRKEASMWLILSWILKVRTHFSSHTHRFMTQSGRFVILTWASGPLWINIDCWKLCQHTVFKAHIGSDGRWAERTAN